jgi:hypothetical protein
MTKDQITDSDPSMIKDDCIGPVDRALTPLAWFYKHNAMHAGTTRWCSTSTAAVLGVLNLAFGNRTPSVLR